MSIIDFSNAKSITMPKGEVTKITDASGNVIWEAITSRIPSEYQEVTWIATDGNQAINTGVMASDYQSGIEYVFKGNCTGLHSSKSNNYLFGCLASGKRSANLSWHISNMLQIMIGGTADYIYGKGNVSRNEDFTIRVRGTSSAIEDVTATYNGLSMSRSSAQGANCAMPSANIYLLAANINGNYTSSTSAPFTGKLYGFTMLDMSGSEICDLVPCYRKSDGVIGVYDIVRKTFLTNVGSGSFTKGADV